jgi:hypothetical protein
VVDSSSFECMLLLTAHLWLLYLWKHTLPVLEARL